MLRSYIFILLSLIIMHVQGDMFQNRLGYCEPFTIEFIAGLVQKKARQLLDPFAFEHRQQRTVRFYLYTRQNRFKRQLLRTDDRVLLAASHFNAAWPVRFSIHGWNGQSTTCSSAAIKDAYLSRGDFNVVLVDWSDYALDINYIHVITQLFEMADQINSFAHFLSREKNVAFAQMYLVGHSLGCHLAGVAGKRLHPNKYGVIYALDSAGPILNYLNETWRLTASDALYVESIQTDISFFGFSGANLAHATFFPNWGLGQPHCPNATAMEPDFVCDHFGSLYYFVESLYNGNAFGAYNCKSFRSIVSQKCGCGRRECKAHNFMGGEPAMRKHGIFYLSTRAQRPFGYGSMVKIRQAIEPTSARMR